MEEDTTRVGQWIALNAPSEASKKSYKTVLRRWAELIYGAEFGGIKNRNKRRFTTTVLSEYIDRYVDDPDREYLDDVKRFIMHCRDEYAPNTTRMYVSLVTTFFASQRENKEDKRFVLDEEDKRAVRRILPSDAPALEDKINTKEEYISILEHCPISTKAVTLFLISSGVRIGESLKVRMKDVHFDTDPPSVFMRAEYLKKGIGVRTVNCSYEARDAIQEWHKARKGRRKKVRKRYKTETKEDYDKRSLYDEDLLFGMRDTTVWDSWYIALKKVGLDGKDSTKKKERYIHHIHTMRKFFKTSLISAGVTPEVVEAWLGHKRHLGMYLKYNDKQMAAMYKDVMWAVSLYGMEKFTKELSPHVIVDREELSEYVKKKWKFVENLGDGTYVVERPGVK